MIVHDGEALVLRALEETGIAYSPCPCHSASDHAVQATSNGTRTLRATDDLCLRVAGILARTAKATASSRSVLVKAARQNRNDDSAGEAIENEKANAIRNGV